MRTPSRKLQFLVCLLLAASAPSAFAHAFLDHAEPKVGSSVAAAPTEIKVYFDDDIKPAQSDIQVFDSKGNQIDKKDSHGDPNDTRLLTVSLPSLSPGTYKVVWHAVCPDSHKTTSSFEFTVTPAK